MGTEIRLGDILERGYSVTTSKLGRKFVGRLAQPVFANIREIEHKKLEEEEEPDPSLPSKAPLEKFTDLFKERFAWGDLITLAGIALMSVQRFFSPAKEGREPGFFEKTFKTLGLSMTFGGSLSAIIGRAFDWHRAVALGSDYALLQIEDAQKKGKPIFIKYSPEEKEKLKREASELDGLLVYKQGVRESILERYAREEIGGLLDGPPGTGKTAGVYCILGKWAKRVEAEGNEAVITELNLANFDEYLKERKQLGAEATELFSKATGITTEDSFAANQGIMILEALVSKIQKVKSDVDKHNQRPGVKKQKLAIFVDEFDKVFDPATLKGCDRHRLKTLLVQLNELFVKTNLLLTSNTKLEDMIDVLKKHLYVDKDQTGREVWEPMYDRFVSKNRVFVDLPSAREQAEIIAGRLISDYSYAIDWNDFAISSPSGTFELDRKKLADAIEETVTSKLNRKMNGRQLKYTCDDVSGMLLGLARELRLQVSPITDQEWNQLTTEERISRTGAKINREIISRVLNNKIDSMKLDSGDFDFSQVQALLDGYFTEPSIDKYLKDKLPYLKKAIEKGSYGIFDLAYDRKNIAGKEIYVARQPVEISGKKYQHYIIKHPSDSLHSIIQEPMFTVFWAESNAVDLDKTKQITKKLSVKEINDLLNPTIERLTQNPLMGFLNKAASQVANAVQNSDIKLDPGLTNAITNAVLKQLSA